MGQPMPTGVSVRRIGPGWREDRLMTDVGKGGNLRPSTQFSAANPWGSYWNALFPPSLVTPWLDFKRRSTGLNVARRLWDQREYLRRTYESVFGTDPHGWPSQHPGVVLDEVL